MREFLILLFLYKSILLNQSPITIHSYWTEVELKRPIIAITSGATIYIKIQRNIDICDFNFDNDCIDKFFPNGSIEAKLIDRNGRHFLFKNKDSVSISSDSLKIIMFSESEIKLNHEFIRLYIRSDNKIVNVDIIWENSRL